jgi:histidyl-tRNA synthetase
MRRPVLWSEEMTKADASRPSAIIPKGFRDYFAADVAARETMLAKLKSVYEHYGFEPLETPAIEYLETLGKYLPDSDSAAQGVFSFRDEAENWLGLRYDLTAPLSRVVAASAQTLPSPYRRYQIGTVWRMDKPGPDRYREFYQCDIDTVGSASMAADVEIISAVSEALEAVGIARGQYRVRVSNRKILDGVLARIGVLDGSRDNESEPSEQRLTILRAIDKLDRLGTQGVRALLGRGREDESGAFTEGAGLTEAQIDSVIECIEAGIEERPKVLAKLERLVGQTEVGLAGVAELREIDQLLDVAEVGAERVVFDPSVVRGLGYYTGPVFEAVLTFRVPDDRGELREYGSVAGGGRYDSLVKRFTGSAVPATGISVGVSRLLDATRRLAGDAKPAHTGPVVVAVLERTRVIDYQRITAELRQAGIRAEMYLGESGLRGQLKYANKRQCPVVVIAGEQEFERNVVLLKDLRLGDKLSEAAGSRTEWMEKGREVQLSVERRELVAAVRRLLANSSAGS